MKNFTCLDFGSYEERSHLYPDIVFCNKCLRYEEEVKAGNKGKIKRTSAPFRCEIKHTRKPNTLILKRYRAERDAEERNTGPIRRRRTAALKANESLKATIMLEAQEEDGVEDSCGVEENLSVSKKDGEGSDDLRKRKDAPQDASMKSKRRRTNDECDEPDRIHPLTGNNLGHNSSKVISISSSSTSSLFNPADDIASLLEEKGMTLKAIELVDARSRIKVLKEENKVLSIQNAKFKDEISRLDLELKSLTTDFSLNKSRAQSAERLLKNRLNAFSAERTKLVDDYDSLKSTVKTLEDLESKRKVLEKEIIELTKKRRNTRRALNGMKNSLDVERASAAAVAQLPGSGTARTKQKTKTVNKKDRDWFELRAGDNPTEAIVTVLRLCMPRSKVSSRVSKIVSIIWSDGFLGGLGQSMMINLVKDYLRKHVFNVPNVLCALDLAGIKCGLTAVEILRKIDAPQRYQRSILPSSSGLHRGQGSVQRRGAKLFPFEHFFTDDGEGFQFEIVPCVRAGIKMYDVEEVAKLRSLSISLTCDGAALNHRLSHLAGGIKWNDLALKHPLTGKPLLLTDRFGNRTGGLQSRDLTMILRLEIAKDNKETAERFRPVYEYLQSGKIEEELGIKKFNLTFPHDKKAHWTFLDRGGAAKNKTFFCYCCNLTSSNIARENDHPCPGCLEKKKTNSTWKCYHHPIVAEGHVNETLKQWMAEVKEVIDDIDTRTAQLKELGCQMRLGKSSEVPVAGDLCNIDYIPQTEEEIIEVNCMITDELMNRNLPVTGSGRERRELLRKHLEAEKIAAEIQEKLAFSQPSEMAFYGVLQAIPCILHLENRIGLTILENVIRRGLRRAVDGQLNYIKSGGTNSRALEFQAAVVKVMETEVLGTPECKAMWRFPTMETDKAAMGRIKMENSRTALSIDGIESILKVVYNPGDPEKEQITEAILHYKAAIDLLKQKNEYSDKDLTSFQEHVDEWYQTFIEIFGREICTNYTHDIASGHVLEYMKLYGPLWRFSNEGWEALNALIKSFYFRRTFRGGRTKHSKIKSRILPIANYCQRKMMWMFGEGFKAFDDPKDPCAGLDDSGIEEALIGQMLTSNDEDYPLVKEETAGSEVSTLDDPGDGMQFAYI